MKTIFLLLNLVAAFPLSFAQQGAVTQTGDEVLLYDDGTWRYADTTVSDASAIAINSNLFGKADEATFLLKSAGGSVGIWLNPKEWSFKKASENPAAEYELRLKGGDLYGMLIAEGIEIPVEQLRSIAIANARSAAPDLVVVAEEYRTVNGVKVLMMQLSGTMRGIKFSYLGYYYSNEAGSYQFMTYTSQALLESYRTDAERLLNGFVEL